MKVWVFFSAPWRRVWVWRYRSTFLDLFTRCKWMVSFMLQPLHPLDRRLGVPHRKSGWCSGEKNLTPSGNQTPIVRRISYCSINWDVASMTECIQIKFVALRRICLKYSNEMPGDRLPEQTVHAKRQGCRDWGWPGKVPWKQEAEDHALHVLLYHHSFHSMQEYYQHTENK
jgi:hypothetical protein